MAARRDYYEVLGVPRDADSAAIKTAFRQLARRYHPDVSAGPDAGQRFREAAEAYARPARRAGGQMLSQLEAARARLSRPPAAA